MFKLIIKAAVLSVAISQSALLHASSAEDIEDFAREISEKTKEIQKRQLQQDMPELLAPKSISNQEKKNVTGVQGKSIYIFVSWSMGDEGLRSLIESMSEFQNVSLVFRGIPKNSSMADAMQRMAKFASYGEGNVALTLDPPRFTKYNITVVPTILVEQNEKAIIQARGLTSPEYMEEALKSGKSGDLGQLGQTLEIAERDLIDVMKERAAALDLEEMKRGAQRRFWSKQNFIALSHAQKSAKRTIDPTVISAAPMYDAKGNLLYPAGASVNPLQMVPFTQRVVVFNPSRQQEVEFASAQVSHYSNMQRVTLIATEFPREETQSFMQKLVLTVGAPVYLLTPDVLDRFELRHTPSLVTADRDKFYVDEIADTDLQDAARLKK